MNDLIREYLIKEKIFFKEHFLLSQLSFIRIGGEVRFFVIPKTLTAYKNLLIFLIKNSFPYRIIGNASNCLFSDKYIDKVFISTKALINLNFNEEKTMVISEVGVMLPSFVSRVSAVGITGFEGLAGIPGTIGGAIYMNAGAFGCEISDNLIDVTYINDKGETYTDEKEKLSFSYRSSRFQYIHSPIISARFKLINGNIKQIKEQIKVFTIMRLKYQERNYPNLGSLFKSEDIYLVLSKRNKLYALIVKFIRRIGCFFHVQVNWILNYLTLLIFKITYAKKKPFSNKTINCLVNRGNLTFKDAVGFIKQLQAVSKNELLLEIEIVE